jgi:two-component system chemotaxis response regulator CheB
MQQRRVLVVDDSAVIRGMITRLITDDKDIEVIGSASNGQMAVQMYKRLIPDIVILDIEMPIMNGIEALKEIMAFDSGARVLMCSTLTHKNAEISLQAMSLGAADYIPKPGTASEVGNSEDFKNNIIRIIKALPSRSAKTSPNMTGSVASSQPSSAQAVKKPEGESPKASEERLSSVPKSYSKGDFTLRPEPSAVWKPKILAIGSSTGGPQALFATLKPLKNLSVPIVITQHMPATFTAILAQHITSQTGITALEGAENMRVESGKAYVAPGGKHMLFKKNEAGEIIIKLDDGPMENFCKPAVDPMLRSLISIYGSKILCAILTGMGHDGLEGAKQLITAGGYLYAQDAKTSVVWGMPGAVAMANICSGVLPVDQIGQKLKSIIE